MRLNHYHPKIKDLVGVQSTIYEIIYQEKQSLAFLLGSGMASALLIYLNKTQSTVLMTSVPSVLGSLFQVYSEYNIGEIDITDKTSTLLEIFTTNISQGIVSALISKLVYSKMIFQYISLYFFVWVE